MQKTASEHLASNARDRCTKVATVRVVHADGTKTETDAIGKGNYAVPVVVDLATEKDVKRLEIVDVSDPYGLGFDDLEFDFPDA